eukprot:3932810-Rhodomonas_salina.1
MDAIQRKNDQDAAGADGELPVSGVIDDDDEPLPSESLEQLQANAEKARSSCDAALLAAARERKRTKKKKHSDKVLELDEHVERERTLVKEADKRVRAVNAAMKRVKKEQF